jgi:arylsulfatase A-like enzyme
MTVLSDRPNLIFILADDLGYADLGCYGGRAPISPVLDRLAAQGLRFTQGYSNSPVCSPTRFALATGRWQYRLRGAAEEPMTGAWRGDKVVGLPPEHASLASLLRDAGYHTALIGKWHLGFPPHFGPQKSGYLEHYGPLSGGVDYFTHQDSAGNHDLWENGQQVTHHGYLTDLISDRGARVVREQARADKPFLLSLHYTAPHWPWETREDETLARTMKGKIHHLEGGSIHVYRRMIQQMDEGIGRVVAALEDTGQLANTLIVFTSDNGGERFSDNWPLVGGKMDLTEGGIRVPYIAHWPRVIAPGGVTAQQAITMDWTATMLEAAGVAADPAYPLDGLSLMPALRDAAWRAPRELFWRMNHRSQRAYRHGRMKYLKIDDHEYLFDVETDERERANQAKWQPELLASMRARYLEWAAQMPAIPPDAKVSLVYGDADMPQR